MGIKALVLLAAAHLASAHFGIEYPEWRADTLKSGTNFSQWLYPCEAHLSCFVHGRQLLTFPFPGGGVDPGAGNRTDWPTTGGSLTLDLHHPWTYVFVNLGLGDNATNFNYTLTPSFWNETGNGTCVCRICLCLSG